MAAPSEKLPASVLTEVTTGRHESDPIVRRAGRLAYIDSIERDQPMTPRALATMFGASETWAKARIAEVWETHGVPPGVIFDEQDPQPSTTTSTRIRAWAHVDQDRPMIYDMPGTAAEFDAWTKVDAARHNIRSGTVVDLVLIEAHETEWDDIEPGVELKRKTLTAEHDPTDMTWLDNVNLQAPPPPTPDMLVELAGGVVQALAALANGLQRRDTPVPVDTLEQLVFHLGARGGAELKKVFDRLSLDLAGWAALSPGEVDEAGAALQNALVWTGEHPTAFDLGITDEHPLEVRAGILGWLGPWFADVVDDFKIMTERSAQMAGLLRVLKHAPAPTPVVDENAGEQS